MTFFIVLTAHSFLFTHIGEGTAGADSVVVAHPALVVWVLASGQNILVASVVGLLIQHPATTFHLDRVAAAEVGVHVRAVGVALIRATLEVSVLIEYDLKPGEEEEGGQRQSQPSLVMLCYRFQSSLYV